MIRVMKAPTIQFTCTYCKAVNEGDADDFHALHTMPPSFRAKCAFCHVDVTCFPSPLIARAAGTLLSTGTYY